MRGENTEERFSTELDKFPAKSMKVYLDLGPAARDCRAAVSTDIDFVIYRAGRDGIPFELLCLAPVC